MTRIFGFERKAPLDAHIPTGVNAILDNLQIAVSKTYERGWQAYGLGFIVVGKNGAEKFSVFKGYQGISAQDNILELLPQELQLVLSNNPKAVFGVLQNSPDRGEQDFESHIGWKFPLESENWFVITMGSWWNDNFEDEDLPWYNSTRPSLSTIQYLETHTDETNFDWIDKRRTPYVIAVKKDGSEVHVVDMFSESNSSGMRYVKEEMDTMIMYQGVRNKEGEQT